MSIARTAATGAEPMLPELLAWSSSLASDRAFAREDVVGSMAHVLMLRACGIVPQEEAAAIHGALAALDEALTAGTAELPADEEDIHMAVERWLTERIGAAAGYLHTARSRNDQVSLDLHLYTRERARTLLDATLSLVAELLARAQADREILLPAYTHRQRAQPVSAAMYFGAWSAQLLRASQLLAHALDEANVLTLGVGATSGTSLPIDREITRGLLGFARVSVNALDTVGDRDFALDFVWAASRLMLALSRLAQDMVDFSTSEFALVRLGGAVSCGSSMMPQKKNPDVFELLRGKSAAAIGRVTQLLALLKALPTGYNRDLQEDRSALFGAADDAAAAVAMVRLVLPHVHFVAERGAAALAAGFTQATDLAEARVKQGKPFRQAYTEVGTLVQQALAQGAPLPAPSPSDAVAAKESAGGTGPRAIDEQLATLAATRDALLSRLAAIPELSEVAMALKQRTV
jgi:argininosuccinate lyase